MRSESCCAGALWVSLGKGSWAVGNETLLNLSSYRLFNNITIDRITLYYYK